jgi:hypothetical protein
VLSKLILNFHERIGSVCPNFFQLITKYAPQAAHIRNWCRYLKRSFSKLSKKIRNKKPTTKEIAMRRRSSYSKTTSNLI